MSDADAALPLAAITGTFLHRAWLKSGRPDPLLDADAWDGFGLTLQALAVSEALAAASPAPLDVERLARAMRPVKRRRDLHYRDGTVGGFREEYEQRTPEEVARAYAEDREP